MSPLAIGSFLLVVLFGLRLDVYLFLNGTIPFSPLSIVVATCALASFRIFRFAEVMQHALWRVTLAWVVLAAIGYAAPGQSMLGWEAFCDILLAHGFVTACLLLLLDEKCRNAAWAGVAVVLLTAVGMNLYEVTSPMKWSLTLGRSAGFFVNPNLAAYAILFATVLLLPRLNGLAQRYLLLLVAGLGVVVTFSRSGATIWVAIVFSVIFAGSRDALGRKRLPSGGALVLMSLLPVAFLLMTFLPAEIQRNPNVKQRIESFQSGQGHDASMWERTALIQRGLERLQDNLLFGQGPGQATRIMVGSATHGTHNEYLAIAIDFGLLGLLIWLSYFWFLGSRGAWSLLAVLGLVCFSMHSVMLQRSVLLMLALYESTFFMNRLAPKGRVELATGGTPWD